MTFHYFNGILDSHCLFNENFLKESACSHVAVKSIILSMSLIFLGIVYLITQMCEHTCIYH